MSNDEMRDFGKLMREKAVEMAMKRKEEYLGARVSKELRDKVINRAKGIGIPVSILIRNTLEEAFGQDSTDSISSQNGNFRMQAVDKFSAVIGWETIELNKAVTCSGCGVELGRGKRAALGLGASEPIVICDACKGNL